MAVPICPFVHVHACVACVAQYGSACESVPRREGASAFAQACVSRCAAEAKCARSASMEAAHAQGVSGAAAVSCTVEYGARGMRVKHR